MGKWGGEALYSSIAYNDTLNNLDIDDEWIPREFRGMSLDKVRQFTTAPNDG